ncbi:hypothetical protein [Corynebacterium hylobatis]|uniref:hypothetical protein n=1 Tax=Corynebacterium hylobatis TaxID=1859290 RepID=UPI0013DE7AE8|nr:hypothetical protein [Corynebacterium hylobatis]
MRRAIALAALTAMLGLAPATAQPALPPGVSVQDLISGPIAVPAGQTTTVDLGVPVSVSHHAGGWSVVSSGTSVSVTAPAEGGASTVVPVSAAGYSASLTLVAEGAPAPAPAVAVDPAPAAEPTADPTEPAAGTDGAASPVASVDRGTAEHIRLESTVKGNRITATLGMVQALKLFNQFKDVSREGLGLRYLDAAGRPIEGVTREIDEVSRTLTLTYPEGQTPDNPFIMEVAREDTAVAVVTLTDPAAPVAPGAEAVDMTAMTTTDDGARTGTIVVAGVVGLVLLVGGGLLLGRRRRARS